MEIIGYMSGIVEETLLPLLHDFSDTLDKGDETQPLMPDGLPDVRSYSSLTGS